ncbi:MAG TPA: prolipoprotein diacylglyceryl transferase [Saprospiraceae bacterium]|nr:prolipoprotein diacylglyceryl transferase [Saprospiraceae bacterium]HMQ85297.1 prolipoprotein diacylglyceryl transferase [Saprospiraceae bacterium]
MENILLYITWKATPEIIEFGSFALRWYGLLFASGFLIGLYIVKAMFKAENAPEAWLDTIFLYMVLGAVIGARLGHVFFYDWDYYSQHLAEIPAVWKGGLASHGGAIGIILALWIFSLRTSKKSVLWILDKVVVPTALAGCFIRLGNLMNSEIVGLPSDAPWAFLFVNAFPPYNDVPRHPVQLYESICYLISFIILYRTYWKTSAKEKQGMVFGLFLILIWGARFVMEYFKTSQGGFETALGNVLSTGQWLSIPFILIGLYYVLRPNPALKTG